jgi:hypothetical protein
MIRVSLLLLFLISSCSENSFNLIGCWTTNENRLIFFTSKTVCINNRIYNYLLKNNTLNVFTNFKCQDTIKISFKLENEKFELRSKYLTSIFGFYSDTVYLNKTEENINQIDDFTSTGFYIQKEKIIGKWVSNGDVYCFNKDNIFVLNYVDSGEYYISGSNLIFNIGNCFRFTEYKVIKITNEKLFVEDIRNCKFEFDRIE